MKRQIISLSVPNIQIHPSESDYQMLNERFRYRSLDIMKRIVGSAKEKTPVRTGRLRSGYQIRQQIANERIVCGIENKVPYFDYIENGVQREKRQRVSSIPKQSVELRQRTEGVRMLDQSIEEYAPDIQALQNEYTQEFEELIQTGRL